MSGKDRQLQTMRSNSFSRKLRRPAFCALILAATVGLAACVYKPTIQQGNLLKTSDVDQVTPGMTRTQVRYLLGTPMINDPFDPQRWDYVYRLTTGRKRDTIELAPQMHNTKKDAGRLPEQEIGLLTDLCETMKFGSLCALGGFTPYPVTSALRHWPEDFTDNAEAVAKALEAAK
jgi:outer membrane protein assembly factor BamE (lipoprotein component of BamABCDE complex)